MRLKLLAVAITGGLVAAAPASAGTATTLERPVPDWYTAQMHLLVRAAGPAGVQVPAEELNTECPGFQERGVGAGGCIVYPAGCTANFIFTDGARTYIGAARHCVDEEPEGGGDVGAPLVMQVDTTTIAEVGRVVKHTSGEGDVGNDFALVELYPGIVATWGADPAIPLIGGPHGVYAGCDPQPVKHYGHGYGFAVAQGKGEFGVATNWHDDGYGWTGFGLPGDSGSPVVIGDNRAAGNFTHLIVDLKDYPGSDLAGMRMTAILQFLGGGISLVNADGSTSTSGPSACDSGSSGGGKGGGNGGGNGGGKGGGKGRSGKQPK